MTDQTPTTPTGKRLATLPAPGPGVRWPDAIIAIEQEAAAPHVELNAEALKQLAASQADPTIAADLALAAAVRGAMAGMTPDHANSLRAAVEGMSCGPYAIAHSPDDEEPVEYATECIEKTLAHADEHGRDAQRVHVVMAGNEDDEVIVAMTGNGQYSEANAEAIAWLLSAAPVTLAAIEEALRDD